jgi:hypothetical protein
MISITVGEVVSFFDGDSFVLRRKNLTQLNRQKHGMMTKTMILMMTRYTIRSLIPSKRLETGVVDWVRHW